MPRMSRSARLFESAHRNWTSQRDGTMRHYMQEICTDPGLQKPWLENYLGFKADGMSDDEAYQAAEEEYRNEIYQIVEDENGSEPDYEEEEDDREYDGPDV